MSKNIHTFGLPEYRTFHKVPHKEDYNVEESLNKITEYEEQQRNIARYLTAHPNNPSSALMILKYDVLSRKIESESKNLKR